MGEQIHISRKGKFRIIINILLSVMLILGSVAPSMASIMASATELDLSVDALTAPEETVPTSAYETFQPHNITIIEDALQLAQFLTGALVGNHFQLRENGNFDLVGMGPFHGRPGVFTGVFDGNGQTIRNLRLVPSSVDAGDLAGGNIGFIRTAGGNARIQNVIFEGVADPVNRTFVDTGVAPTGWAAATGRIGTVVGNVESGVVTIENVRLTGTVHFETNRANTANNKHMGGFVGFVSSGATLIINNISTENLFINNQAGFTHSVGGVIGTSAGTVLMNDPTTGGGAAFSRLGLNITGLSSTANNAMPSFSGGVIGRMEAGHVRINNVMVSRVGEALTHIHGRIAAGGIVGWTGTTGQLRITNASNSLSSVSTLMSNGRAGGIVGRAGTDTALIGVRNDANVMHVGHSTSMVGGIIGAAEGITAVNGAMNTGNVVHIVVTPGGAIAPSQVGGIIGRSANNLQLNEVRNLGTVANLAPPGRGSSAEANHAGGIVGQIMWPASVPMAQRRAVLTYVSNMAAINSQATTNTDAVGTRSQTRQAGGIVGTVSNIAGSEVFIRNAENFGPVRARARAGGIIGWANGPNITIRNAVNHGFISVTFNHAASRAGGIVGDSTRPNLVIERAGNTGTIRGLRGAGGVGGILGRSSANGTVLREVYNYGHVSHASNAGAGGIMGHNTGTLLISDFASLGSVQGGAANAAGSRSGSGVLGLRAGGAVRIERGFVSGNWGRGMNPAGDLGPAVAISGTGSARPVSGITFSQVYVIRDTAPTVEGTTNANDRFQQVRPGITSLPTELLTSGYMPGFNELSPIDGQPTWRFGLWNPELNAVDPDSNTHPYFPWQISGGHGWERPFFGDISIQNTDPPRAPVSAPVGSASPTINIYNVYPWSFMGEGAPWGTGVQIFNPYQEPTRATRPGPTAPTVQDVENMRFPLAAEGNHSIIIPNPALHRNEVTIGLISQNNVTAFSGAPLEGLIVLMAVDAVTGEQIQHAVFPTVEPFSTVGTIWVPPGSGEPVVIADRDRFIANSTAATVEALGYTTRTGVTFTQAEIDAGGTIRIPMVREAMNINVRAMTERGEDIVVLTGPPNPALYHTPQRFTQTPPPPPIMIGPNHWSLTQDGPRTNIPRAGNNGVYSISGAFVGDRLEMRLLGFASVDVYLDAGNLEMIGGVPTLDIVLNDIRNQFPVTIRVWEDTGEVDAYGEPVLRAIPIGTVNVNNWLEMTADDTNEPSMNPIPHTRGAAASNQFTFAVRTLTTETLLQVLSHHHYFVDSDIYLFGDVREHRFVNPDADVLVPNGYEPIDIILRPVVAREVHVMEQFGPEEDDLRHINHATLRFAYAEDSDLIPAVPPLSGIFPVRLAEGDEILAAAYGFHEASYTLTAESGCPFDPGDCPLDCYLCPEHIIIVLDRQPAEPGVLDGFVRNAIDRTPIEDAEVVILDANTMAVVRNTTTNAAGFYSVEDLPSGTYLVMAVADYFKPGMSYNNPVVITANAGGHANVYLYPGEARHYYSLFVNVTPQVINRDSIVVFFSGDRLDRDGQDSRIWSATFGNPQEGTARASTRGFQDVSQNVVASDYNQWRFATVNLHFELPIQPGQRQVTFFRNDGSDPQVVHYIALVDEGHTVDAPVNPVRTGYTFLGWYTDPVDQTDTTRWDFGEIFFGDLDLYARWLFEGDNARITHTIRFFRNDGTELNEGRGNLHHIAFVPAGDELNAPAEPLRVGFSFEYWSIIPLDFIRALNAFPLPMTPEHDFNLYARWHVGQDVGHSVVFRWNTGPNDLRVIDTVIVSHGQTVTPIPNPNRVSEGFTFIGWEIETPSWAGSGRFNFGTRIIGDLVLNAVWLREDEPRPTYTVLFERNDGSDLLHYAAFVPSGDQLRTFPDNPRRVGWEFQHWFNQVTNAVASVPMNVPSNMTLLAQWEPGDPNGGHRVVFMPNDGFTIGYHAVVFVDDGGTVLPPENPVRPRHTFLGWEVAPGQPAWAGTGTFNFGTLITGDLVLNAMWRYDGDDAVPTHIVRFFRNDGTHWNDNRGNLHYVAFVPDGERLNAPLPNPVLPGFEFRHWSDEQLDFIRVSSVESPIVWPMTPTGDEDVFARWQIIHGDQHTVVFRWNTGVDEDGFEDIRIFYTRIVNDGQTVMPPPTNPNRVEDGFTFLGWEVEAGQPAWAGTGPFNFGTPIMGSLVLNAIWRYDGDDARITHTVLFYRNDGTPNLHHAAFVPHGDALTLPADPLRSGWNFVHWSDEAATNSPAFTFPATVTSLFSVHAQWEQLPTLPPGYGGIFGLVTGPNGPIGNATVIITGSTEETVLTNASGMYVAYPFAPGTYTVTVVAPFHGIQSRSNIVVVEDEWTEENFHFDTRDEYGYALITTVTGPPPAVVTVATGGVTLTRIDDTNMWSLRTREALPATQLVHASAGATHRPNNEPVGDYDDYGVARVLIDMEPIVREGDQRLVTFFRNDGTVPQIVHHIALVDLGRTLDAPVNPVREGWTFRGWYEDPVTQDDTTRFDFGDTNFEDELRLYARWTLGGPERTHIVRFFRNDDSIPPNLHHIEFVPHGSTVDAPVAPTRVGFTFMYWTTTPLDFIRTIHAFPLPMTPEGDIRLYARWQIGEPVGHTVVFRWNTGVDEDGREDTRIFFTRTVDHGQTVLPPSPNPNRVAEGYTFIGWEVEEGQPVWAGTGLFNFGTRIIGDLVLNAVWCDEGEPRPTYTVHFHRNDGSGLLHYAAFVQSGTQLREFPANPRRVSFGFVNWTERVSGDVRTAPMVVTASMHLDANWDPDEPGIGHRVVFMPNDDGFTIGYHAVRYVNDGRTVLPPENPERARHTFLGWEVAADQPAWAGTGQFNFGTPITGDLVLNAMWRYDGDNAVPTHIVRFFRNDGTLCPVYEDYRGDLRYVAFVPDGGYVDAPYPNPERRGFEFRHWSEDMLDFERLTLFVLPMRPTGDMDLFARWRLLHGEQHTVVFRWNTTPDDLRIIDTIMVNDGQTVSPIPNPNRVSDGFTFLGWEVEDNPLFTSWAGEGEFCFGTPIIGSLVLNAMWRYDGGDARATHTLSFYRNDGTPNIHRALFVPHGDAFNLPVQPLRASWNFLHWSDIAATNSPAFDFPATATAPFTVFAQWTQLPELPEGYGGIFGLVTGPGGAIANSTVIVTGETGRTVLTNANGSYTASPLVPGAYTVTVIAPFHGIISRQNIIVVADEWTEENFHFTTTDDYGYTLITTVTGPPPAAVTVATSGVTLTRIDGTNMWSLRTVIPLPSTQLVHASAGATHHPDRAPVGQYTHRVARVFIELEEVGRHDDQRLVTFFRNDGIIPQLVHHVELVDLGRTLDAPRNPVREGWTFLGWYTDPVIQDDSTRWDFGRTAFEDGLNLYARWRLGGPEVTHTIRFFRNDDTQNLHHIAFVPGGEDLNAPEVDPTRVGFSFEDWTTEPRDFIRALNGFIFPMTPEHDFNLHARWRIGPPVGHSVVFRWNTGPNDLRVIETVIVAHGDTVTPIPNPNRVAEGFTFIGWEIETPSWAGSGRFNFGTRIIEDLVLNAVWLREDEPRPTYTVLFERNDSSGLLHYAAFVPSGDQLLTFPDNPRRVGWDFVNWLNQATDTVATVPMVVSGDMTLHATWIEGINGGWRVTFMPNDGFTIGYHAVVFVDDGATVLPPENPVRPRHTFLGWEVAPGQPAWAGTGSFNFGTLITGDLVLNAMWRYDGDNAVPTHIIQFFRNDGTHWNNQRGNLHYVAFVPDGERLNAPLPNPVLPGFIFDHWNDIQSDFIRLSQIIWPMTPIEDLDLYAIWRLVPRDEHTVVFRWNTGVDEDGEEDIRIFFTRIVNHGQTVMPPPTNPNRVAEGYTFLGWEVEEGQLEWAGTGAFCFGTPIIGNLVLNAIWRYEGDNARATHTLLFHRNDGTPNLHRALFVPHGDALRLPVNPVRSGWNFVHWSEAPAANSPEFDFPTIVTAPFNVHAQWVQLQPGHSGVRGTVTAAEGGAPITNASITLVDAAGVQFRTTTDEQGLYSIANITPGNFVITVVAPLFLSQSTTGKTPVDDWAVVNFQLADDPNGATHILEVSILPLAAVGDSTTVTMDGVTFNRIGTGNVWEARGTAPMVGTVRASAQGFQDATRDVVEEDYVNGIASVTLTLRLGGDVIIDVDEDGNLTITTPPGTDYTVVRDDDGGAVITLPPEIDEDDIGINLPPGWNYEIERDSDDDSLIITITPPGDFVPGDDEDVNIEVDDDGNLTITTPPGVDYEVENDDDGNVTITFPPEVDEDDVMINVPPDWDYDMERDDDDNLVITLRPLQPGFGNIQGTITSESLVSALTDIEVDIEEAIYELEDYEYEYEYEVEVEYEYEVEVEYEYEVEVEYEYEVEVEYEYTDENGDTQIGITTETRIGITTEVRVGTRVETRIGIEIETRTETRTGVRAVGSVEDEIDEIDEIDETDEIDEIDETDEIDEIDEMEATPFVSRHAVPNADIVIISETGDVFTTTTDENGLFSYTVPVGQYTVVISANGFEARIHPDGQFTVRNREVTDASYHLEDNRLDPDGDYRRILIVNVRGAGTNRAGISVVLQNEGNLGAPESGVWYHIHGVDETVRGLRTDASSAGYVSAGAVIVNDHYATDYVAVVSLVLNPTPRPPGPDWTPTFVFPTPPPPLAPPFVEDHIWFIQGYPDGTVRPEGALTRAEVSMILWRLLDSTAKHSPQVGRFSDVQSGNWYAQAINYLASNGILMGFPDGTFRPNDSITRAELTAVMSRFFDHNGNGTNNFSDVEANHWAIRYIDNAHNRGWITGFGDTTFRPNQTMTRAEAVTLINRVTERIPNPVTINYHLDNYLYDLIGVNRLFIDLTSGHWAFYQIMEAAIEHEHYIDENDNEVWTEIFIPWFRRR